MLYTIVGLLFLVSHGYAGMIQYSRSDQVAAIEPHSQTHHGDWGEPDYCYDGSYAAAFQMNVELGNDDESGVNAVVLFCKKKDDFNTNTNMVVSKYKKWGKFGKIFQCPAPHFLKGVAMKSVPSKSIFGDDLGANNFQFSCQDGSTLTGDGGDEGVWSSQVTCPDNSVICGIKTKVEDYKKPSILPWRPGADNTALNEAIFYCCHT